MALAVFLCGCTNVYQELLTPRVTPNGVVRAAIDGRPLVASTGMGQAQAERLQVTGFSPELTFGLVAGEDAAGRTAKEVLVEPGSAIALEITPLSATQLQVHMGGTGCKAQEGTLALRIDKDRLLEGEFEAMGVVTGGDAPCALSGTLERIPIER